MADSHSSEGFDAFLHQQTTRDFVNHFFPDPIMAIIFCYVYLCRSIEKQNRKARVNYAYKRLHEQYGVERPEFDYCEADLRRFMQYHMKDMQRFLAAPEAFG